MKAARFDDTAIELTDRFISALEEVLRAECEMMMFDGPDMWFWGRATITDLALSNGIKFTYGSVEDMPSDGLGRFAIVAGLTHVAGDAPGRENKR